MQKSSDGSRDVGSYSLSPCSFWVLLLFFFISGSMKEMPTLNPGERAVGKTEVETKF